MTFTQLKKKIRRIVGRTKTTPHVPQTYNLPTKRQTEYIIKAAVEHYFKHLEVAI